MAEEVEKGCRGPLVSPLDGSLGLWQKTTGVILDKLAGLGLEGSMHCIWKLVPPPGLLLVEMKLLPSSQSPRRQKQKHCFEAVSNHGNLALWWRPTIRTKPLVFASCGGGIECSPPPLFLPPHCIAPGQGLGTQEELQFLGLSWPLVDAQGKSPGEGKRKDGLKMRRGGDTWQLW